MFSYITLIKKITHLKTISELCTGHIDTNFSNYVNCDYIRDIVFHFFLAWRLQASDKEIEQLFVVHPGISKKSFRIMEENISMAQELGFSLQKILKCGYIIKNFPEYTKQTLKEFPTLAGYNIKMALRSYPTLVVTPTIRIRKTYQVLKVIYIYIY